MPTKTITQNNLHLLRILNDDLSQRYVAYKLGISQVAYSKIERGQLAPSAEILNKILLFYGLESMDVLFLPKSELKRRVFTQSQTIEFHTKDAIKLEFDILKRKLDVMIKHIKCIFW